MFVYCVEEILLKIKKIQVILISKKHEGIIILTVKWIFEIKFCLKNMSSLSKVLKTFHVTFYQLIICKNIIYFGKIAFLNFSVVFIIHSKKYKKT